MNRQVAEARTQSSFSCPQITAQAKPSAGAVSLPGPGDLAQEAMGVVWDAQKAAVSASLGRGGRATSLVGQGITLQGALEDRELPRVYVVPVGEKPLGVCEDGGWLKGVCAHGAEHWVKVSCKRRTCPVCGELRKRLIAWRVERGIELLGGDYGAGWFVGTHADDVDKREADRIAARFIRKVKAFLKSKYGIVVEWVHIRELTGRGRLHHNVIFAPWVYIPQAVLSGIWQSCGGAKRVWIERVGAGVGVEAAKLRSKLAHYLAKYDQMVLYGRGISYSKSWPKLPDSIAAVRRGRIYWTFVGNCSEESILHWYEAELGHWRELFPGEWGKSEGDGCRCFDFVESS